MDKLQLIATSVITAVGPTGETTAAAVKAGISAYADSSYISRHREPLKMAKVPDDALPALVDTLRNTARLGEREKRAVKLMAPVVTTALDAAGIDNPIACFLAAPEPMPGVNSVATPLLLDALVAQTGVRLDRTHSRVIATGRAGGFHAITQAFQFLASSPQSFALVGGVDTFQDVRLLSRLDGEQRILFNGNPSGFVPGEAAGFLLLGKLSTVESRTTIFPPGEAMEEGHMYSDQPYRGEGLALAVKDALQCAAGTGIRKIYSSLNGEDFFVKELGVAMSRNQSALADAVVHHPADCLGDVGAASAAIAIALIEQNAPGNYLAYGSSDGPYRAAVCISRHS
jgi:3-oxoacyl-[acyl-carrier-protein] synthase I